MVAWGGWVEGLGCQELAWLGSGNPPSVLGMLLSPLVSTRPSYLAASDPAAWNRSSMECWWGWNKGYAVKQIWDSWVKWRCWSSLDQRVSQGFGLASGVGRAPPGPLGSTLQGLRCPQTCFGRR